MLAALAPFVLLTGCPSVTEPPTTPVWQLFPFDGERESHYVVSTNDLDYRLAARSTGEAEAIGEHNVYTVDYTKECVTSGGDCLTGDRVFQLRFSSDDQDGVLVHAYDVGDGFVDFSPPVQVATDDASKDDVIETVSGGATWTSTFLGIEECPIRMSASWPECGAFRVATDGDSTIPLVGTWWAAVSAGVAAYAPGVSATDDAPRWELSSFACTGDCDGEW